MKILTLDTLKTILNGLLTGQLKQTTVGDAVEMSAEMEFVTPTADSLNQVLTDENNDILIL